MRSLGVCEVSPEESLSSSTTAFLESSRPGTRAVASATPSAPLRGRGRGSLVTLLKSYHAEHADALAIRQKQIPQSEPQTYFGTSQSSQHLSTVPPAPSNDNPDALFAGGRESVAPSSLKDDAGKPIDLLSNYIRVISQDSNIYQYHCVFHPEVDSIKLKKYLLLHATSYSSATPSLDASSASSSTCSSPFHDSAMEFDGNSVYLRRTLSTPEVTLQSVNPNNGESISISLRYSNELSWKQCPRVFNVIFKNVMKHLNLVRVGRGVFDPENRTVLPRYTNFTET